MNGHESDLDGDVLLKVFEHVGVLDWKRAACVNKQWNSVVTKHLNHHVIAVTTIGSNELVLVSAATGDILQRLKAARAPNKRRRKDVIRGRRMPHLVCKPICMATDGPSLFVCQSKVPGVLEFRKSPDGLIYRRVFCGGSEYDTPEGVRYA